jgi:NDP-sugar pyrophosphorylase family protein
MRAMVLAAGMGTRLRPLTWEMPKPLVPVANRPVMEHILRLLARHGHREAIANVSHLPEMIRERFGDGSGLGIELSYSVEAELLGTAGGVRGVAEFLTGGEQDSFLVISGDGLTDLDLAAMRAAHEAHGGIATLALKRVADPGEYGVVITGSDGRIQAFQEKPDPAEALSDLANCGIYMFREDIFDHFPDRQFADWAMDVFPRLLEDDVPMFGHEIDAYWNDVGSLEEYLQGNVDALEGAVVLEIEGEEISAGMRVAEGALIAPDAELEPPILIGAGARVGAGSRLDGPLVLGERCRVGEGARVKRSVLLAGAEAAPGSILVGAIAARRGGGRPRRG